MVTRDRRILCVLDYSGTLSPGAVRFARPEELSAALRRSGLADVGVADLELFWSRIIDTTWQEGGSGRASYAECLVRGVLSLDPGADTHSVRAAAERFAGAYYRAASIEDAWRPLLARVADDDRVLGVIATDNYREATGALLGELARLAVPARRGGGAEPPEAAITVENSADRGRLKSEPGFWELVRDELGFAAAPPHRIVVIDDFGANELAGDAYSASEKVEQRRARTEARLTEAFGAPVTTVPCVLPVRDGIDAPSFRQQLEAFVSEAEATLRSLLH